MTATALTVRQRYRALQDDEDSVGEDVEEAPREPGRTRKPLDTSWASIGRDLVEVFGRLPADVAYLLNRLPDDARRIEHPKEFCFKIGLILVALAWFWSIVRVLWSLDLNLRQQIFGLSMHKHVSSSQAIQFSPQNPYSFVNRWPQSIQEDFPEHCSFRQQNKMRKKLNHLTVRLGLGIPDVKRHADIHSRLGFQINVKEHPSTQLDYITHVSTLFRGIPSAHQAHLDEYFMLKRLLESCEQIFGKIFSLGDEDEHVASSLPQWSDVFQRIHEEEGEQARNKEESLLLARLQKEGLLPATSGKVNAQEKAGDVDAQENVATALWNAMVNNLTQAIDILEGGRESRKDGGNGEG